jgi:hypothetical protein
MFKKFLHRLEIASLYIARIILLVICAPFSILMLVYGCYFISVGAAWIILVVAAYYCGFSIFVINSCMMFIAFFDWALWSTMGNMWEWLWNWFIIGHNTLWPHIVRSFPPYVIGGFIYILLYTLADDIKQKIATKKIAFHNPTTDHLA